MTAYGRSPIRRHAMNITVEFAQTNRQAVVDILASYGARKLCELEESQLHLYILDLERRMKNEPKFAVGDRVILPDGYGVGVVEAVVISYRVRREANKYCKNPAVWDEAVLSRAPLELTIEERVAAACSSVAYSPSPQERGATIIETLRQAGFYIREVS